MDTAPLSPHGSITKFTPATSRHIDAASETVHPNHCFGLIWQDLLPRNSRSDSGAETLAPDCTVRIQQWASDKRMWPRFQAFRVALGDLALPPSLRITERLALWLHVTHAHIA